MSLQTTKPTDAIVSMISDAVIAEIKQYVSNNRQLMCERDVLQMLGIKDPRTLKEWANKGLEVYTIGRNRFYFLDEIEDFIRDVGGKW